MVPCAEMTTNPGNQARGAYKGLVVAQYSVVEAIGDGPLGRTFRAVDMAEHCEVALKVIPRRIELNGRVYSTKPLIGQVRRAAELDHPLIALVYEIGQQSDVYYIASELACRGSVQQKILSQGSLNVRSAVGCILNAAEALAVAHHHRIVHGNLKPGDLLIGSTCYCKVSDFGFMTAGFLDDVQPPLSMFGRPRYLAPEVIAGDFPSVHSDVYSLGATLFFLLAGQPPFSGTTFEDVLAQRATGTLPDVREYRPDVPQGLARVITKAMAHNPDDRYRGARAFIRAIHAAQQTPRPRPATPPVSSHQDTAQRPANVALSPGARHWLVVAIIGIGLLAGAVVIAACTQLLMPDD